MDSSFKVLRIIAFLDMLAAGLLAPLIPYQARMLGNNQILIGLMGSIYWGFQILTVPIAVKICNVKEKQTMLLISLVGTAFAYFSLGLTSNYAVFFAIRCLLGIFNHTQVFTKAFVPDCEENKSQQLVVYRNLAVTSISGMCLGGSMGCHILEKAPNLGFITISTISALLLIANTCILPKLPKRKESKINTSSNKKPTDALPKLKLIDAVTNNIKTSKEDFQKIDWNVKIIDLFICHLLITLSLGVFLCNQVLFVKIKHQAPISLLGYLLSFQIGMGFLGTIFSSKITGLLMDYKKLTEVNFKVFLSLTVCLTGVAVTNNFWLYLFFLIVFILCSAVSRVISLEVIIANTESKQKESILGASASVRSLTNVIAPLIAGFVGHYAGILKVIYVSLGFTVAGLVISYKTRSQNEKSKIKMH